MSGDREALLRRAHRHLVMRGVPEQGEATYLALMDDLLAAIKPTDDWSSEETAIDLAIRTSIAAADARSTPEEEPGQPFVVRQFEGRPWVPLREAARLHDAVQEAGLTIAGLRNALLTSRSDAEREAMFLIARLVEAAGGEIRLTHRVLVADAPTLVRKQEPLTFEEVFFTTRSTPE